MKKINLNPSTQKELLKMEERKWAVEKIIFSLTVILLFISMLFSVKAALFFFIILIYEIFLCAASFNLFNGEPTINKISDLLVGLAFGTVVAVILIKANIS